MTPAEVNQLRLQFRSIQAARHTPDNMPSPDTMRSMEDAWLDGNANSTGSATATANTGWFGFGFGFGGGGGGSGGEEDGAASGEELGLAGLVDVMIRGMMIGFLWPLASMTWLLREEGIWSKRWQVFVTFGFLLSITIGLIRGGTKDG